VVATGRPVPHDRSCGAMRGTDATCCMSSGHGTV
jgi:hypothetical protein